MRTLKTCPSGWDCSRILIKADPWTGQWSNVLKSTLSTTGSTTRTTPSNPQRTCASWKNCQNTSGETFTKTSCSKILCTYSNHTFWGWWERTATVGLRERSGAGRTTLFSNSWLNCCRVWSHASTTRSSTSLIKVKKSTSRSTSPQAVTLSAFT